MKNSTLKWLLEVADRKPLLFSIAILLIAISTMAIVVKNRDGKVDTCTEDNKVLQKYYNTRIDSITNYYVIREGKLQEEIKKGFQDIIDGYKNQLDEQKKLNTRIISTINNTKRLISKSRQKLKKLSNNEE